MNWFKSWREGATCPGRGKRRLVAATGRSILPLPWPPCPIADLRGLEFWLHSEVSKPAKNVTNF